MKRRIAPEEERCTAQNGQHAIWKARRLGKPVEVRCSRKRLPWSVYCPQHEPGRGEPVRRQTPMGAVLDFLAARAQLIRESGPPSGGRNWWTAAECHATGRPTQGAMARRFGLTVEQASTILAFRSHQSPPLSPHRRGATWRDQELIAVARRLTASRGCFPALREYRELQAADPSLPYDTVFRRMSGGSWETVAVMAAVPMQPRIRHYTDAERAFIEDHAGFLGAAVMAERLGRSHASVRIFMSRNGISAYREAGYLTEREAAREYRVSHTTLRRHVNLGAIPSTEGRRGTSQRLVFLDPLDIEAWLERRRGGLLMAGGSE